MFVFKMQRRTGVLHILLGVTPLLTLAAAYQIALTVLQAGIGFTLQSGRWLLAAGLAVLALGEAALWLLSWTSFRSRLLQAYRSLMRLIAGRRIPALALFALSVAAFPWLVMGPAGAIVQPFFPRLLLFWAFALFGGLLLAGAWPGLSGLPSVMVSALLLAFFHRLSVYIPEVSTYPFSLGWSEGSRYYYASLFFSERIYGVRLPTSVLHPSRYLMQAVPFLIPDLPLWAHRLWQALLWIGTSLATGILLAKRLSFAGLRRPSAWRWLFIFWSALFLFQGPVYYHLLVPVIIVLATFNRDSFWRSLLGVLAASAWAGISRVNWMPVPALIASTLYFLEVCFQPGRPLRRGVGLPWLGAALRYSLPAIAWFILGGLTALGAQRLYILWSGNNPRNFSTSFSSDLLWYRLLPNATYPLGLLPSVLLVSAPALILVALYLRRHWDPSQILRFLGLAAILLVLLAGGLVVSVKIGGGSNLHNVDAYLVILWIITSYLFFEHANFEQAHGLPRWALTQGVHPRFDVPLLFALILLPALFAVSEGQPVKKRDPQVAAQALATIQKNVDRAREAGGEVLFITERHLLTFGYIDNAPLQYDYEKVFLMEMVMAREPNYMDEFREDISTQSFGLIVSDPLYDKYKDREVTSWAEENNAWVEQVAERVMCYYWRKVRIPEIGLNLLTPRAVPQGCP